MATLGGHDPQVMSEQQQLQQATAAWSRRYSDANRFMLLMRKRVYYKFNSWSYFVLFKHTVNIYNI